MGTFFKPTPLTWEDVKGGLGEVIQEGINDFVWEYCQPEEPIKWADDEELGNDLAFFAEAWEQVDRNGWSSREVATPQQTAAALSLICGAFYTSISREEITSALVKSATKAELVEILTHVASAYCQYVSLKARIGIAKTKEAAEHE